MPTNLVLGVNTMNCDATTNSAAASQQAPETRGLRFQATNVSFAQNGQGTVRGLSLATLAAALAACGGGGSGGPAAPPPPPPPPPPNNPPAATDATGTAVEDGDPATGGAVGSDEDGDALTYSVTNAGSLGTLTIADDDSWSYAITDSDEIQALGVGDTLTDTATIEVSDGEDAASATITITIKGANDLPMLSTGTGEVDAGPDMAAMGKVEVVDVDSGDAHTFEVTGQTKYGKLAVDEMGAWTYMLDHENEDVRKLGKGEMAVDKGIITVTDSAGGSVEIEVSITVTGIVEAPDVDLTTSTVEENDMAGPYLAEVTSLDAGVTFSVDNEDFEIVQVGSTHVLKVKDGVALDHEGTGGSIELNVFATDGAGNPSDATTVTVMVSDVNEMPMITAMSGAVDENAAGATVGAVMVSDYDAADQELSADDIAVDDPRFEVVSDGAGGFSLKLKDGMSLDHETEASVMVTVMVTDTGTNGDALSVPADVMVTVNDVNEAPRVTVMDGEAPDGTMVRAVISENATGAVGQVVGSDVDIGDMLGYSVDDGRFTVEKDDMGDYWLNLNEAIDFEEESSVSVTVTVTDDNDLTGTYDFMLSVTDADEDPTIEVTNQRPVEEDEDSQQDVASIAIDDVDAKDTLDAGDIEVSDNRFVVRTNSDGSLTLVLVQPIDAEEETSVPVTLTVTDGGGNDASTTIDVMIAGENELPTISIVPGVTPMGEAATLMVDENRADAAVAQINAMDPEDGALNEGSLKIVDADGKDVTDGPFMIASDPRDGISWLKLASAQDFETDGGTHTVIVRVTDAGGLYVDQLIDVTINDINEAPTASDGSGDVTAGAETPDSASGELAPTDEDAGTTYIFSGQEAAMYGTLMIADDGAWTYTVNNEDDDVKALNEGGMLTESVTVTVTDNGDPAMSAEAIITVMIAGVNDAPEVTVMDGEKPDGTMARASILENVEGTVGEVMGSDVDDGATLTYSTDDERFDVEMDDKGNYWLELNQGVNFEDESSVTVTVTVSDGDLTGTYDFTLDIIDADEDPTIKVGKQNEIKEDLKEQQDVASIEIDDVDAKDTLDAGDITVSDDRFVVRTNADGSLTLVLVRPIDAEEETSVKVTLTVTDGGTNDASTTIDVMIDGKNEKPTIGIVPGVTRMGEAATLAADENKADVPIAKITAYDPEDKHLNHGSLMIVDKNGDEVTDGPFEIVEDTEDGVSWLRLKTAQNFEIDGGMHSVTIRVTDTVNPEIYAEKTIDVTINDVNEMPKISDGTATVTAGDEMPATGDLSIMDEDMAQSHMASHEGAEFGTLVIAEDGSWTYTVDESNEKVRALKAGDMLTDLISVTVTDDGDPLMYDDAMIAITITGINDAPEIEIKDSFFGADPANSTIKENETRAVGEVIITDAEGDLTQGNIELSDSVNFMLETDGEYRIWLKLVNSFDYEALSEDKQPDGSKHVTVDLTLTDGDHKIIKSVTIKVLDDNDPPTPTEMTKDEDGTHSLVVVLERDDKGTITKTDTLNKFEVVAGVEGINVELDLESMFEDQDDDQNFKYHLEGAPSWLKLTSSNPVPGEDTRWMLESTEMPGNDEDFIQTVKLVAVDQRDGEGKIEFTIIWDDGNEEPYDLIVRDSSGEDGEEVYATKMDIPENLPGVGTGLYVSVKNDDNPDHAFGRIKYSVDNDKFEVADDGEIRLKEGESLDYEDMADITLVVTATDSDGADSGLSTDVSVIVSVGNENDPVTADEDKGVEPPGDWWVTIDDDLDPRDEEGDTDYISEGAWLTLSIEEGETVPGADDGDAKPLFKDEDGSDDLTYSLKEGVESSKWLMIDPMTGVITNRAGMVPPKEGIYPVVVVATDMGDKEAEQEFMLAVAFSRDNDGDGVLTRDNDASRFRNEQGDDVDENEPAGTKVASFSIEDDEWALAEGGHPFAPKTVTITGATTEKDGVVGTPLDAAAANAMFEIVPGSLDGNLRSYTIVQKVPLDFEMVDEYEITISVQDGVDGSVAVTETVTVDVQDVNEEPMFDAVPGMSTDNGGAVMVDQQEGDKEIIWLNLTRLFSDQEDGADDRDDLKFSGLNVDAPGVKALHGGIRTWEDVEEANESDADFEWGGGTEPDRDDYVLILEVDRTAATGEDGQDTVGEGTVSVTVTDTEGKSITHPFKIVVEDENVLLTGVDAGTGVTFVDNVQEGERVIVRFNEEVDPDFDGTGPDKDPVAVLHQVLNAGGDVLQASLMPEGYEVKQSDVGGALRGQVIYFQLHENSIVRSVDTDSGVLYKDSMEVTNREDRGTVTFGELGTGSSGSNEITIEVTVTDEDVGDASMNYKVADLTYQWQYSDTGTGGWVNFDDGDATATITDAQSNKYVRVEVTYDGAHGDTVRDVTFRSEATKVGAVGEIGDEDIAAPTVSNTVVSGDAAIGAVLSLPKTVGLKADIQWNADDMPIEGATGRTFTVTEAQAGLEITVTVREMNDKGGLTSVNTSGGIDVDGAEFDNNLPQGPEEAPVFDLGAAPATAGTLTDLYNKPIEFNDIFSDHDEDELTFKLGDITGAGTEIEAGSDLKVFLNEPSGDNGNSLLIVDPKTGEVWYHTTQAADHDGASDGDGMGNIINLPYTASDDEGVTDSNPVNIGLRIDVKGSLDTAGHTSFTPGSVAENAAAGTGGETVLTIDVYDENEGDHAYGMYEFVVTIDGVEVGSEDSPFMLEKSKTDGSVAVIKLKEGMMLDYETLDGKAIVVMAESVNFGVITGTATVGFITDDTTEPPVTPPPASTANDIPGLQDNDETQDDDVDEGDDDDTDGGVAPTVAMLDDGLF